MIAGKIFDWFPGGLFNISWMVSERHSSWHYGKYISNAGKYFLGDSWLNVLIFTHQLHVKSVGNHTSISS